MNADSSTRSDRRWIRWAALVCGVAAVIVVATGLALRAGGDDRRPGERTNSPPTVALPTVAAGRPLDSTRPEPVSTTTSGSPTTPDHLAPDESATAATASATVPDGATVPPQATFPIPRGTVPDGTPDEVCGSVLDRLAAYRSLAATESIPALEQLLPQLEQFEYDIFTWALLAPWGDQIVEQLVNARREWTTAVAANDRGDATEADTRITAGMAFLDRALAVTCPPA